MNWKCRIWSWMTILQDWKMQDLKKEDQQESGWKLKDHSRSYIKAEHSKIQSCIFQSCIFQPFKMVLRIPVLHFPALHFPKYWSCKFRYCFFWSSIFSAPIWKPPLQRMWYQRMSFTVREVQHTKKAIQFSFMHWSWRKCGGTQSQCLVFRADVQRRYAHGC